ncbi:hypothetical protein KFL_008400050 [Klebsormidium nitens]|uniref:Uncharacterized protein n=1 Tax=Klebsormidium nitens TaxID=105231 RepID=A0A1Y1ISU5_KLENI|nr:hypothetical protein KFL_008400050 [Klebsormidium nitens]|eukprot:GAQ91727.1 hypothetical protein KFL_008400050 [Klebsormidium nitens]
MGNVSTHITSQQYNEGAISVTLRGFLLHDSTADVSNGVDRFVQAPDSRCLNQAPPPPFRPPDAPPRPIHLLTRTPGYHPTNPAQPTRRTASWRCWTQTWHAKEESLNSESFDGPS